MEFDLQALIPIIVVLLIFIFSGSRRRKTEQRSPESNPEIDASPDSEVVLPPFMENFEGFPSRTEFEDETVESSEEGIPMVVEQLEPELVQELTPVKKPIKPPPVPVDSPTSLPTKPISAAFLLNPSLETFRQGIILAEVLGKPKGLRSRQ